MILFTLPAITFITLLILEKILPTVPQSHHHKRWDHILNCIGLFIQGCIIPATGYWISQSVLPLIFSEGKGSLPLGWWGCFLLNIIFIDLLYYWQHRAFHTFNFLWGLHKCHHASQRVDIWITSRNSILINFLFVYCLINPILAFFCDSPMSFYTGAMITASLDIFRHSHLDLHKILPSILLKVLSHILVMPCQHHQHHQKTIKPVNLSANFIIWDILFGTAEINANYPKNYGIDSLDHPIDQLLYPITKK